MADQGQDLRQLDLNYWNNWWDHKNSFLPWHEDNVNPVLVKNIRLLDGGKKNLKIFVPLCGKTLDMKWFFDQGHRVVGVDCCQLAFENFFEDLSMEYTFETLNGIPVFSEKSGRLVLYCCNVLDFHKTGEGSFDAVWDRASFGAINPEDRTRYVDLLTSLKSPNARHLLEVYEYDDRLHKEPPFSLPMSKVLEYWGERHNITLIDSYEAPEIPPRIKLDLKSFRRNVFLLNSSGCGLENNVPSVPHLHVDI